MGALLILAFKRQTNHPKHLGGNDDEWANWKSTHFNGVMVNLHLTCWMNKRALFSFFLLICPSLDYQSSAFVIDDDFVVSVLFNINWRDGGKIFIFTNDKF